MIIWQVDRSDILEGMYGEMKVIPTEDGCVIGDIDEEPPRILAIGTDGECRGELGLIVDEMDEVYV